MTNRSDPAELRQVRTDVLDIAYHETGPADGDTVLLLHGFPYDIHAYGAPGMSWWLRHRPHAGPGRAHPR